MATSNTSPADSLIAKHNGLLEIMFMEKVETLSEAMFCEERGWISFFLNMTNFANATVDQIRTEYSKEALDAITYHRKVCGSGSFEGTVIGCNGVCDVSYDACHRMGLTYLTAAEAEILKDVLSKVSIIPRAASTPYNKNMLKLVVITSSDNLKDPKTYPAKFNLKNPVLCHFA